MRPFLFLATRPEPAAADDEYAAMLRCSGLDEPELRRVRLDRGPLGDVDLDDWSGVILGGGPFQSGDPHESKSGVQRRVEAELAGLLDRVVPADFPFFGACYGIGTLGTHEGAVVDRRFGEPAGGIQVLLTQEGRDDPVLGIAPPVFGAFVGHKEAVSTLPPHAVRLATSTASPVQAFRVGRRVYATQFHPELDLDGLVTRMRVYRDEGYFPSESLDELVAAARATGITEPPNFLGRFVELYARPAAPLILP
jgi:GMP synthase (glutamine-hydrolysing)